MLEFKKLDTVNPVLNVQFQGNLGLLSIAWD